MNEVWADIKGLEGLFQISTLGRVKSLPRLKGNGKGVFLTKEIILKPATSKGYKFVYMQAYNEKRRAYVHRLVADAFIENPEGKPDVNHKDGDPANNNVENLEWCTESENIQHCMEKLGKKNKPVVRSDGKRYRSAKEAAADIGVPRYMVYSVLEKISAGVKGYNFSYEEDC